MDYDRQTSNNNVFNEEVYNHFEEILFTNLLKVLETRPKNPVSKFSKMILADAGLDRNGEPIEGKQPVERTYKFIEMEEEKYAKAKKSCRENTLDDWIPKESNKRISRRKQLKL